MCNCAKVRFDGVDDRNNVLDYIKDILKIQSSVILSSHSVQIESACLLNAHFFVLHELLCDISLLKNNQSALVHIELISD